MGNWFYYVIQGRALSHRPVAKRRTLVALSKNRPMERFYWFYGLIRQTGPTWPGLRWPIVFVGLFLLQNQPHKLH